MADNPAVRSLGNLGRIFEDAGQFSVEPANQTYRPVVTASLAVDYALGHGYTVFWFHLSTLLWFLVLVVLIKLLFERLLNIVRPAPANNWLALGIAAWFGLHPAMAETVNYIIQRADLYCTLGCVAALYLYARFPGLRRTGLYLLPFTLAMLSKPPATVFPVLLMLYVFFFESAGHSARRWRLSLIAALPALGLAAILLFVQMRMTPETFSPGILSASDYRLTQPFVWLRYVGSLFLPIHLNVDTDLNPFIELNGRALIGILFVCGLIAVTIYAARGRKLYPIAFGLAWFMVTQVPTSLYTLSEVENDHRMFFSFPGLMLAVVWGFYLIAGHVRKRANRNTTGRLWMRYVVLAGIFCILCGYAYGAHRRNAVWRSEETLWADDVVKSPHNGRGLMMYGLTRMTAGDLTGARLLFEQALQYSPNFSTLEVNLGVVNGLLADRGEPMRARIAEDHFRTAEELAASDDTVHAYYGRWLMTQGRLEEAVAELKLAVSLNSERPDESRSVVTGVHAERKPRGG